MVNKQINNRESQPTSEDFTSGELQAGLQKDV